MALARDVGTALAQHDIHLVYGGGYVGMMGQVADAALAAGGRVTGIIPEHIRAHEVQHTGLTELVVVDNMYTRKSLMAERSDAFVALPGGFGTLDEVFEILDFKQLGLHVKPVIFYNLGGFWDPLLRLVDHLVEKKFVIQSGRATFQSVDTLDGMFAALDIVASTRFNPEEKWHKEEGIPAS